MQRFVRWALYAVLFFTVGWVCTVAQEAQSLAPIYLTFPLKATVPNQDQHLTSATAPVNSVFDHSMLDATTTTLFTAATKP